jgi:hypothetical protein
LKAKEVSYAEQAAEKEKLRQLAHRFDIPPGTEPAPCKGCSASIYWVERGPSRLPLNEDGTSHFATCPKADTFRRKR